MKKIEIAFIGGSGLYKIPNLKKIQWLEVKTNFGKPSSRVCVGQLNNKEIAFLPRHGMDHNISPSKINYQANIESLKNIGVQNIISLSAVGSLRDDYKPGDFVIVDQFIDKTYLRRKTFFDDDCVVHVPMSSPTCKKLMHICYKTLDKIKLRCHFGGTYICIEGPQFSTLSESKLYRSWGCDVIGMTNMPEAKLAKEAGICYATISMVTDYDCWHPDHESVTINQIINTLNKNSENAFKFINQLTKEKEIICDDETKSLSKKSLITNLTKIKKSTKSKLKIILNI